MKRREQAMMLFEKACHDQTLVEKNAADSARPVPEDLQDSETLTPYAVLLRYDAPVSDLSLDRQGALEIVRRVRAWVEPQLGADANE